MRARRRGVRARLPARRNSRKRGNAKVRSLGPHASACELRGKRHHRAIRQISAGAIRAHTYSSYEHALGCFAQRIPHSATSFCVGGIR